jgi:hypothetical protein
MTKTSIKQLSLAILAVMVCGATMAGDLRRAPAYNGPIVPYRAPDAPDATTIYSNLIAGGCEACTYSTAAGWYFFGPNNCLQPGTTYWWAFPFVARATSKLTTVQAAVTLDTTCTGGTGQYTMSVYSADCTNGYALPATALASAKANAATAACGLSTARFRNGPTLTAGTTYFVVGTTAPTQSTLNAVWWNSLESYAWVNLNDTTGWLFAGQGPGAFAVIGQ